MRALQLQVKKRWAGEVVPRHSAVGQSASNGFVEQATRTVDAQLRTMLLAFESGRQQKRSPTSPIIVWLVEYTSGIINRCKIQKKDHTTSYQRKFGKKDVTAMAEFGDIVHYMLIAGSMEESNQRRLNKAEPRYQMCVYIGF